MFEIEHISIEKWKKIKCQLDTTDFKLIEIDGRVTQTVYDFVDLMIEYFELPDSHKYRDEIGIAWDAYIDRMRESYWLAEKHVCLAIHHYAEFLKENLQDKTCILEIFEIVIDYWRKCSLRLEDKGFDIYLVD